MRGRCTISVPILTAKGNGCGFIFIFSPCISLLASGCFWVLGVVWVLGSSGVDYGARLSAGDDSAVCSFDIILLGVQSTTSVGRVRFIQVCRFRGHYVYVLYTGIPRNVINPVLYHPLPSPSPFVCHLRSSDFRKFRTKRASTDGLLSRLFTATASSVQEVPAGSD